MLDIKYIRENPEIVKAAVLNKKSHVDIDELLALDIQRRDLQSQLDGLNQKRNEAAKQKNVEQGKALKEQVQKLQEALKSIEESYQLLMYAVPNIPTNDTPIGKDEDENVVLKTVGNPKEFTFVPKEHWELGEAMGLIDNETASAVSGARFTYLFGELAMLEFALVQFVIGTLTSKTALEEIIEKNKLSVPSKPFVLVVPPVFIKPEIFERMGRLEPKDDRYYIPSDDLFLIGSAEHTLGPIHMDTILSEAELPIRYLGFSTAFRREAGSYGKDTRGILRLHQFDKLEMESFAVPSMAHDEQLFFVAIQEYIMQSLEIPYRLMSICTGDMGAPDAKQIDLESWMPGQGTYRETHTSDLMTDFQARRLNIKYKNGDGKNEYVNMNDATATAIGRTIIAIMENYQQEDGSIIIPRALQPFMFGITEIRSKK